MALSWIYELLVKLTEVKLSIHRHFQISLYYGCAFF